MSFQRVRPRWLIEVMFSGVGRRVGVLVRAGVMVGGKEARNAFSMFIVRGICWCMAVKTRSL